MNYTKTIQCPERTLLIAVVSAKLSIFDLRYYLKLLFQKVGTLDNEEAFTYISGGVKKKCLPTVCLKKPLRT